MAIYEKRHVAPFLKELDEHYQTLRAKVNGSPPDSIDPADYQMSAEQFEKECAEIKFTDFETEIDYFRVTLKN